MSCYVTFAVTLPKSSSAMIHCIQNIADIQFNIWCYLQWEVRLILREVSGSCCQMHRHLFYAESKTIAQFMDLSLHIHTIDPHTLIQFFLKKRYLNYIEPVILAQRMQEMHECMLIEKIMVDITERAVSFVEASRSCTLWLNSLSSSFPPFERNRLHLYRWPEVDGNGSVIPCDSNLDKLFRIFRIAKIEMPGTLGNLNFYSQKITSGGRKILLGT